MSGGGVFVCLLGVGACVLGVLFRLIVLAHLMMRRRLTMMLRCLLVV